MLKDAEVLNRLKFLTDQCFLRSNKDEVFTIVLSELKGFLKAGEENAPQYYNDLVEELIQIIDQKSETL